MRSATGQSTRRCRGRRRATAPSGTWRRHVQCVLRGALGHRPETTPARSGGHAEPGRDSWLLRESIMGIASPGTASRRRPGARSRRKRRKQLHALCRRRLREGVAQLRCLRRQPRARQRDPARLGGLASCAIKVRLQAQLLGEHLHLLETEPEAAPRWLTPSKGGTMGDKSRKSKQRNENQKNVAKATVAREAKSKQDRQGQVVPKAKTAKGKK